MASLRFAPIHAVIAFAVFHLMNYTRFFLAVFGMLSPVLGFAQSQMATPGSFAVSSSGGASYSIPIQVPPGTAGMQPSVALVYQSQRGNSLAGVGWSLSAGSVIRRCAKTYIQDGTRAGVTYATTDRLCLDGERLVLVAGTYGLAGSQYRTEHESFSKIDMLAANDFEVRSKSGEIAHYRAVSAAPPKNPIARQWVVDRITDRAGNFMTYAYIEDIASGSIALSRIDYTGNTTTSTYASVQFLYAYRTDTSPIYEAGAVITTSKLLTNIQTFVGANLVKDYQLVYEAQLSLATGRQRLSKVIEHGRDNTNLDIQLPSTNFTYSGTAPTWNYFANLVDFHPPQYPNALTHPMITGDFNGDGKTDIARVDTQTILRVQQSNGDGTWTLVGGPPKIPGYTNANANPILTGDFNGDGKVDIAWVGNTLVQVWSFINGVWTYLDGPALGINNYPNVDANPIFVGDFNGDGRSDFGRVGSTSVAIRISNGDGTWTTWAGPPRLPGFTSNNINPIFTGDFNGDGKTDVAWAAANGINIYLSDGIGGWVTGTPVPSIGTANGFTNSNTHPIVTGDFNGDGNTDIARVGSGGQGVFIFWANGAGGWVQKNSLLTFSPSYGGFTDNSTYPFFVGDFNGDGRADLASVVFHS